MRSAEEDAFVEFATTAATRLRHTAYLLCGDWHRSADLTQEALIRMYVVWPRLTREGRELAYARKAVTSAYLDACRRRSAGERPAAVIPEPGGVPDPSDGIVNRSALMTALALLPPRQRACVVLRYLEDLDVRETARVLGCSDGTVKSQTAHALTALRTHLDLDGAWEPAAGLDGRNRS